MVTLACVTGLVFVTSTIVGVLVVHRRMRSWADAMILSFGMLQLIQEKASQSADGKCETPVASSAQPASSPRSRVFHWRCRQPELHSGFAYGMGREYEKAIVDYTEAIRLGFNDPLAYNNRGNYYMEIGDYERAIADYSEAIRGDLEVAALAYNNRGLAYEKVGETAEARADFLMADIWQHVLRSSSDSASSRDIQEQRLESPIPSEGESTMVSSSSTRAESDRKLLFRLVFGSSGISGESRSNFQDKALLSGHEGPPCGCLCVTITKGSPCLPTGMA